MKKKGILLLAVILLSTGGLVQAQERKLTGTIDVTYLSKYVWRGYDIYDDKSAIQPSIDLDLYGTGFGMNIMGHRANSDGHEDGERWDYTLYYYNSLFGDEAYATNYRLSWVYYNYPDNDKKTYDLQEINAALSWPKILPIEGLVPTYVLVKLWPSCSGQHLNRALRAAHAGQVGGWAHIFMLDYPWAVQTEGLLPGITEQVLNLHTEFIYNDGALGADHDWSNTVLGISTDFDLGHNLTFTPGVYHQITMDKSVNDDKDETWVSLGMKYRF